jgi:PDZ domain
MKKLAWDSQERTQTVRVAIVLVVLLTLSGCAVNGFAKYYQPARGSEDIASSPYYIKPPPVPKLYAHGDDVKADAKHLQEQGYVLIGTSSFFGPSKTGAKEGAIAQGKGIGAALIMIKSSYKDTLTGTMPLTLPNAPQVATVNTNGTVYTNNGSGSYNSTSTVTMPGGSTTYNIPYAVSRSDFFASYWAARDTSKLIFGSNWSPLPDDVRSRLQRNTGLLVTIVVNGTPAFRANLLEGDILLKINGEDIVDAPSFTEQLKQRAGQAVDIGLIRGTQPLTMRVALNARS